MSTVVFITIDNEHTEEKLEDNGYNSVQMGQPLWVSLLNEVNYVLEQYEITGNKLTGITVWHSPPDASMQSACWMLTVLEERVEALQTRVNDLVTKRPYGLVNGAAVLAVKVL